MNRSCFNIQSQLSAWIDGELSENDSESVRVHIAECPECRSWEQSLQQLDMLLDKTVSEYADVAERIAANVLNQVNPGVSPVPVRTKSQLVSNSTKPSAGRLTRFLSPLVAAAAGFLLAWILFGPASHDIAQLDKPRSESGRKNLGSPDVEPVLAHLVASTGNVEYRPPDQTDWLILDHASSFRCSPGSEVRTPAGIRCELQTEDRCTIRLNETTQVAFRSPHEIELRSGQVWCCSTSNAELQIIASPAQPALSNTNSTLCFTCPPHGTMMSEVDRKFGCQVQSPSGEANVRLGETKHRLQRGEIARFENGQLIIQPHHADSLLATSWMQPLLIQQGHDSPELGDRVNKLLANLGHSKIDHLYEEEIRSLGDYAVLPLLRFVQSEASHSVPDQRLRAMSIVSDMAPSWLIGDLIDLLADAEPQVRVRAATALQRLTGQSQGREPAQWSASLSELKESLERWRTWWQKNSDRYNDREKGGKSAKTKLVGVTAFPGWLGRTVTEPVGRARGIGMAR